MFDLCFWVVNTDKGDYEEVMDCDTVISRMEEYLQDYNGMSKRPMNLAMFLYAVEHVSRICRVLNQAGAHMLMAGLGGSGRQSLCRLAGFISNMQTFQVRFAVCFVQPENQFFRPAFE